MLFYGKFGKILLKSNRLKVKLKYSIGFDFVVISLFIRNFAPFVA